MGRLAVPLLLLVSASCSQAAPANRHQLQARLSSIPAVCGVEKIRLQAVSPNRVAIAYADGAPAAVPEPAFRCIAAEVKKISGVSLSPIGDGADAAEHGPRET